MVHQLFLLTFTSCEIIGRLGAYDFQYGGLKYRFITKKMNWEDAERECVSAGGHLVTISSPDLNQKLKEIKKRMPSGEHWIGYNDKETEGTWQWVNPGGQCKTYTSWDSSLFQQPNGGTKQNCAKTGNGKWRDYPCSQLSQSICEIGPKSKQICSANYKPWGSWSRCTEPCGGGEQTRYRECEGPKELCERRIDKGSRKCNIVKCRFPKRVAGDVKYYETDDGMCLSDFSEAECTKIAKALNKRNPEILNKDHWYFPHGCYHSINGDMVFYNEKPSTKRCDAERKCLCRIALGKEQLIDWIYGDPDVNHGKSDDARKRDSQREMEEDRCMNESEKKNRIAAGDGLYELMDQM